MCKDQWESGIVFIKRLHALSMRHPWSSHTGVVEDSGSLKWYVVSNGSAFIFRVKQAAIFIHHDAAEVRMTEPGVSSSLWLLLMFGFRTLWLEAPSPNWRLPRGYHHHHSCEQNGRNTGWGGCTEICWRGETKHCGGTVVGIGPQDIFPWSLHMLFVSCICTYKEHTWIR